MRWGTQKRLWLATLLFFLAACVWFLHDRTTKKESDSIKVTTTRSSLALSTPASAAMPAPVFPLLSQPGLLNSTVATLPAAQHSRTNSRFAHRLANTTLSVGQLAHKDKAILLENALLDTEAPLGLEI